MISFSRVSSGVKGLDEILNYQQTDDNVVMQVDDIDDDRSFFILYVNIALENNERIVYLRFARHQLLLEATGKITIYKLNALDYLIVDDTPDAGTFDSAGVVFISIFLDAAPFNVLQFHNEVAQSFFGRH